MPRPVVAALLAVLACLACAPAASAHWGNRAQPARLRLQHPAARPVRRPAARPRTRSDQIPLYDGLTPLRGNVTEADITELLQARGLHAERRHDRGATTGRPGLTILRDSFGVPHIYGQDARRHLVRRRLGDRRRTAALLLLLGRGPARAAVADVPGVNAFWLVTSGARSCPSAQAEALVTDQQQKLDGRLRRQGPPDPARPAGVRRRRDAPSRRTAARPPPWTVNDAIAVTAFIGSIFGNGGGAEVAQRRLPREAARPARRQARGPRVRGPHGGRRRRRAHDHRSAASRTGTSGGSPTAGSPLVDPGSLAGASSAAPTRLASNFLIVNPFRSATREIPGGDGPAARLLLPRDRARGRPARPRHPGPGRARARAAARTC